MGMLSIDLLQNLGTRINTKLNNFTNFSHLEHQGNEAGWLENKKIEFVDNMREASRAVPTQFVHKISSIRAMFIEYNQCG